MAATKHDSKQGADSPMNHVTISEAEDSLGQLVGRVEFGREEIVITKGKNKRPVAKLVPVAAA